MSEISFTVRGTPVPEGNVRAFGNHVVHKRSGSLLAWRAAIATEARAAMQGLPAFGGPVRVYAQFVLSRPPSHFRTDGTSLVRGAARYPRTDIDKLARALLDALTGVAFDDDSQVTSLVAEKDFDDAVRGWQGVEVSLGEAGS